MAPHIFALGSNGSGQLGIGHKEDVSVPKPVLFHLACPPPSARPLRIVAGGNHTLLLTAAGELFSAGDATTGACGKILVSSPSPCFQPFDLSSAAVAHSAAATSPSSSGDQQRQDNATAGTAVVSLAAATWEASIFVLPDAVGRRTRVVSTGVGLKGELGQGPLLVRLPAPAPIPDFPPPGTEVVDLAACAGHVVAVLDSGEAWGWGAGRKGQLGTPEEAVVDRPRRIDGVGFPVSRAVCGREFTCLFGGASFGRAEAGEAGEGEGEGESRGGERQVRVLGSDKWNVKTGAPVKLPGRGGNGDVGAGWGNVFVLEDGKLMSWGRDDHGQLAPADYFKTAVVSLAAGSEHAVALEQNGDVTAWGWGEHGNCGPRSSHDGETDSSKGMRMRGVIASSKYLPGGSKITGVGAGCATSWVFVEIPDQQQVIGYHLSQGPSDPGRQAHPKRLSSFKVWIRNSIWTAATSSPCHPSPATNQPTPGP